MATDSFGEAIARFGVKVKAKLRNAAADGAPEDQLRAPLEAFVKDAAVAAGVTAAIELVGETNLSDLRIRPDYAVTAGNVLVGFVEVKAPGKGADPRRFATPHDKAQWARLKALPNLVYTDGNAFSLWRDGEIVGKVVAFDQDVETAGSALTAPDTLLPLLADFLTWKPTTPRTTKTLAAVAARLCRLLRDEVIEELAAGNHHLALLKEDWRALLFPNASDADFADGYAQAVTFGLLIARASDVDLHTEIDVAASRLKRTNSLIGTALSLLTESPETQAVLKTSFGALKRVLAEVDWHALSKDRATDWLYFYEEFLEVYDNDLKKRTGSYYTPPPVVDAMVRLVDEALRGPLFQRSAGLASGDVTVADPAVGTGTFLLGVLARIAANVAADQGEGAVPAAIAAACKRLFGFELQFGPFAVAQLRLLAEMRRYMPGNAKPPALNLYVTNTLDNPFVEDEHLPQVVEAVAKSRREANRIKRDQRITVVIGNPPYKEKAEGRGGWVESGAGGNLKAPLDWWKPPVAWGVGAHTKHLRNLYVYFWRWAAMKVFGAGHYAATGLPDFDGEGLVCFITVAGFLNGPGFEKMRDDLRRSCSEIWIVDCSPEGHQPDVPTRIFQGVQQPICIVIAARKLGKSRNVPATTLFRVLPPGRRTEKFAALAAITLDGPGWEFCQDDWRAPFLPIARGLWGEFAPLRSLFGYDGSGVMPGRTWIIAPDSETLERRWDRLIAERDPKRKEELFHPHLRNGRPGDKHSQKSLAEPLAGQEARLMAVASDKGAVLTPIRYAFRSFDRQWIIPDGRLINQPNPKLWTIHSSAQVHLSSLDRTSPSSGPAVTFSSAIVDLDYYNGRGGRVYPLWADAGATVPNVRAELLALLATTYGVAVTPEDVFAYVAGVMAHPAFTARFREDLLRPGLRLPLTADASLFAEAVALGREVIWLHTYGERFVDAAAGRPKGPPRMAREIAPTIPAAGAIPPAPEPLPDEMRYEPETGRLHVGKGHVANVTAAMNAYEVSGKNVLRQWFSYRKRDRSRPVIGDRRPPSDLEKIQPESWPASYTEDLLNLLHVLGRLVALEPAQADLLDRICAGALIGADALAGGNAPAATGPRDDGD